MLEINTKLFKNGDNNNIGIEGLNIVFVK